MEIARKYFYLNAGQTFQGIIKLSCVREHDTFLMKFELFKFLTNDINMITAITKLIEIDNTNNEIIKKIDMNLDSSCYLDYNEVWSYLDTLNTSFSKVLDRSQDTLFNWNIANKIKIIASIKDMKIIYSELDQFYKGFSYLTALYDCLVKKEDKKELNKSVEKITNQITNNISVPTICTDEIRLLDTIMDLSINKVISASLIHLVYNYYQHISDDSIEIKFDENKNKIISIPLILPTGYIFDTHYFRKVVWSLKAISTSNLEYNLKHLINIIKNNEECQTKALYIMMSSYLLFVYVLRYMLDTHHDWVISNFDNVTTNPVLQQRVIEHHLKTFFPDLSKDLELRILNNDVLNKSIFNRNDLEIIGEKYRYLIPISADEFINTVFQELESNIIPKDININSDTILDLNELHHNKEIRKRQESSGRGDILFTSIETEMSDTILKTQLLNYNFQDGQYLTIAYDLLMKYISNEASILLIKEEIPLSVKNLFDKLKTILNATLFDSNQIQTLQYYRILCEQLPDSKVLSHDTILYIIYQIIIPYYYHIHKITKFIDCLI